LGAVKVAGELRGGWKLGLFSALSDDERAVALDASHARVDWPVQPRALVTIARGLRQSESGDSQVGFFASDLDRSGLDARLADQFVREAVGVGVEGRRRFANRRYELRGWSMASRLRG